MTVRLPLSRRTACVLELGEYGMVPEDLLLRIPRLLP